MNQRNNVLSLSKNDESKSIDFDDITPCINPSKSADLERVLRITPSYCRLDVALAFTNLGRKDLFLKSGVMEKWTNSEESHVIRWIKKETRLPLGVAFRLAKVLGVPAEILFEYYI